jgi:hypothetical protein
MSRGPGINQRNIMTVFSLNPDQLLPAIGITGAALCKETVTNSEVASHLRALRSLVRQGKLVDMGRGHIRGHRRYALPAAAKASDDRLRYFRLSPLDKVRPIGPAKAPS